MDDQIFSSIDFVGQCLVDEKRIISFRKAIRQKIKRNDVVLDLGTGSGILAAMAAKAGARKVFAIEYDPFVADIAKNIFRKNDLHNTVTVLKHDARKLSFKGKIAFNAILAEMLTTGMVDEHQVAAINNLHLRKLIDDSTVFIPERQETYAALAHTTYSLYGLKTPMILHLWRWHNWRKLSLKKITRPILLNSVDFRKTNPDKFNSIIEFTALSSGEINAIYLTSISVLAKNITVSDTEALNAPMLIPIEKRRVTKDDIIRLRISYAFGGGYGTFKAQYT